MTNEKDNWEERFRKLDWNIPSQAVGDFLGMTGWFNEKVEFLRSEKDKSYREGLERALEMVKENHKGSFTDDAGHDCWYVDELIKLLTQELDREL